MKRKTKRFSAFMLAAAMAFGLSTSAFAEAATPETVAVQSAEQSDSAATLSVTRQVSDDSYGEVQNDETSASSEAIAEVSGGDTYATLQAAVEAANGSDVILLQDVAESIVVPGSSSSFNLDLNGHALKAENGKEYAIISNVQTAYIKDTSADKAGAVYGTVDFANTKDSINFIQGGNFHATTGPAIITAGGVTVSGGSFYGASNQPVLDTHEDSKTPGYTFMGGSEIRAGEDGKIFDGFDGLTEMNFILTNYCSSENTKFYGDLGISAARIQGGYFDRQVPENLLSEGYGQTQQENGLWKVARDTSKDAATVTGNGISESYATVSEAMWNATRHAAESSSTSYTVTLQRDVIENVLLGMDGVYTSVPKIELDLNGHTLTAKSANAAALSVSGVDVFLRGNKGTINGRVETNSYLWMIHTTVNALEGQPAIANLSKDNDSLSIKGTSVINGAAGQAVIVSNGRTTVGDGSKVVAGKDGILFEKGEDAANLCFFLDYCTLYGDLGYDDTLNTIYVNTSNGKCFTKFDREPSVAVVGFVTTKGSDGLYTYVTAPVSATVGSQEFTTLQQAIDYAAANGGTPKMVKSLTENVTIPAGATLTIDMNGSTLTGTLTNNGALILQNGSVSGNVAMGKDATLKFNVYDALKNAALPTGYTLTAYADNGFYSVVAYDVALHATVKTAYEKVNAYLASIDSAYSLDTLTTEQMNALTGIAYGDDTNPITVQYKAIRALNQEAMRHHLSTTRIGVPYNQPLFMLVNSLYSVANKPVENTKQQVESKVDTNKTELPKVDEKVPEDKQPTQDDAAKAAKDLKDELTGNGSVNDFDKSGLKDVVKIGEIEDIGTANNVSFSVSVVLTGIELEAQVVKDEDGKVTEVKLPAQKLVFDVKPMVSIDNGEAAQVDNDSIKGSVTVRLPIPKAIADKYAKVVHAGDADRYVEIKTAANGDKYIEFTVGHFSEFTVTFTNELPVQPVESTQPMQPAQSAQSTPAPATKQDDSAYYTCKACGYHDWTAVDGGYKCNHCGYIESVKQLAGYPNVKGTATVGKAAANAGTTKAAMSAIPQTSDDMPITALAIAAIAALLGLGVTVALKRKNQ